MIELKPRPTEIIITKEELSKEEREKLEFKEKQCHTK